MSFYCPDCHHKFSLERPSAEEATCPDCGHQFEVPDEHREGILKPGTEIAGFEIVRLIGSGGMGQVYEAKQISLNRPVALKILANKWSGSDKIQQRFLLEVRATASLQHPNIVTVYEADSCKDYLYLAMALINGKSVDQILEDTDAPIPEKTALTYCRKVAEAMAYAWRHQKLLHRDIKPGNILLDQEDEVKLCDLGIAKRPTDEYDLTKAGMAIGTPHYMSPEQGQGLMDIDFRSDIYSLGASLYHMLTAHLPFTGDNAVSVITKQIMEPMPHPHEYNPDISAPAVALLEIMMAKLRDKRHASWPELIHDFDRVLDGKFPVFQAAKTSRDTDEVGDDADSTDQQQPVLSRRDRGEFRLVRIAALIFGVVALLSLVIIYATQPVRSDGSAADQILVPDNGSSPLPSDTAYGQTANVNDNTFLLDSLPEPDPEAPGDTMRAWIQHAATQGVSPIELADQFRQENELERYENTLLYCVREHPGPEGQWAAAAARELLTYYEARQRKGDMIEILRDMLDFVNIGQAELTAQAYVKLTDYLITEDLYPQAEATLRDGLKKYGDTYPGIADALLLRLIVLLQDQKRTDDLRATIREVLEEQPENSRSHHFAAKLAAEYLDPSTTAESPPLTARQKRLQQAHAKAKPILEQASAQTKMDNRAALLSNAATVYQGMGFPDESCRVLQQIVDSTETGDAKHLGAKAMWRMANIYRDSGQQAEWQQTLMSLLNKKYYGPDGRLGLQAARQLADHYSRRKNRTMQNRYLQIIIDEFPGAKGQNAGAAGLEIARNHQREERRFLARRMLLDVAEKYPGAKGQYRKRAQAMLKQLEEKLDLVTVPPEKEQTGPFKQTLHFDPINEQYVEYLELNRIISEAAALTVECWFRQDRKSPYAQGLISRHGNNKRGFNLLLEDSRVVFQFSDTKRDYIVESDPIDTSTWHHAAVVIQPEGVLLFVDGKRVAARTGRRPVNQGAGRLRVGRIARKPFTHFNGHMQNVLILPTALYTKDFKPEHKIHHQKAAAACLVAAEKGPRELTGHSVRFHSK